MEYKKRKAALLVVGVLALLAIVIGAAYAYLALDDLSEGTQVDFSTQTNTTDSLVFKADKDIKISASSSNFVKGGEHLEQEVEASVTLMANNFTNEYSENYNLYLNINRNNFVYSTTEKYPELLLKVFDPDGTEITTLSNLKYVTYKSGTEKEVSGFDITNAGGLIEIVANKEIKADESNVNNTVQDKWRIKIVLVNLDTKQNDNGGDFEAKLLIQKEEIPKTIANQCMRKEFGSCIAENYTLDNTIIYHNGTVIDATYGIIDAEDKSYRYAGPSEEVNNFLCFGSDEETCLNDNLYRIIGVFNEANVETGEKEERVKLIKYNYALTNLLGMDGEYKNNYVENGYNIKNYKGLIEIATIPGYGFNTTNGELSTNEWTISRLNTVNLNINYINNIGENWADKIAETIWKIGGMTWAKGGESSNVAKNAYNYELGTNSIDKTYRSKVGLMYMSDYYYAADSTYWTYYGYNDDATKDYRAVTGSNWMYMGLAEWPISPCNDSIASMFYVNSTGYSSNQSVYNYFYGIRPSFYLKFSTILSSGSGTMTDPYRIS